MKKDTRELLLDSAFQAIYKNGYQGSNIAEILKEVGINKGSMYHFFKSKKALALAAIKERIQRNLTEKYSAVLESKTPLKTMFDTLKTSPDTLMYGCPLNKLSQEMIYVDSDFSKVLSEVYSEFETLIKKILEKAIQLDEIKSCDVKENAKFIIASYEGALMIYHLNQNCQDFEQIIDRLKSSY